MRKKKMISWCASMQSLFQSIISYAHKDMGKYDFG